MALPADYVERVYAGVLGKMIGVYLGRPFEGWTHERILAELGPIDYYVHDRLGQPLIVTDDDLSGTFTFLRALPDHGNRRDLTPAEIGETWRNYIIEERTILWWGGLGVSTEHTAFLRLKAGILPPQSGSAALNSPLVAEQIGAQIFIDGWAMVAPGDPAFAADLARRAASVSHDGEAIYAAQVIAALEAQAFVEPNLDRLLDTAVALIPPASTIYRLIAALREWHAGEPDWQQTRRRLATRYGYDHFGGGCHVVPNHALIILALLYGGDDFQHALRIVNTSGWDTDCNSGNVGCLLGIKNGLAGLAAGPDWRGPLADRLYLPTAEGGRAITDAVIETYQVVNIGRALAGLPPLAPKGGARFHWDLPGAVQGWQVADSATPDALRLENVPGHSRQGTRSLALHFDPAPGGVGHAATPTFIPPDAQAMPGYSLLAAPTLYAGQTVRLGLSADAANPRPISAQLYLSMYDAADRLVQVIGPGVLLAAGDYAELDWMIPDTHGAPIAEIGVEVRAAEPGAGSLYLDYLTWDGAPTLTLEPLPGPGQMWRRAWVDAVDEFDTRGPAAYRLTQHAGTGLVMQGTRDWRDYRVSARVTPDQMRAGGIGVRVQGLRRYYALLLDSAGVVRLVKVRVGSHELAVAPFAWTPGQTYELILQAAGARLQGWVDDQLLLTVEDDDPLLAAGGLALICEAGSMAVDAVRVQPAR